MTTTIIVAGRECRFIDRGGYWRIGDLPWNQPKRINWLCGDGQWHTSLLDSPAPNQWPTEAAAREFARSLAAAGNDPYGHKGLGGYWSAEAGPCICDVCNAERRSLEEKRYASVAAGVSAGLKLPVSSRIPKVSQVNCPGSEYHGLWYVVDDHPPYMIHLQKDGKWHNGTGGPDGHWPTREAAEQFALAARSQPAEGADGWPINAKDAAGIAIHAAAALARFSNWGDLPPELSSAMCRKAVEIRDAVYALKRLPTPPVPQSPTMPTDQSAAFGCVKNTIRLRSGCYFDFLNPQPDQFTLADIAGALSKICRFGGQCDSFYSVAEHSVHCTIQAQHDGLPLDTQVACLMHDAAEAFCGDVVKPLKIMLAEYGTIEDRVEAAIAEKFTIDFRRERELVREIDHAMLIAERRALFSRDDVEWFGENQVRKLDVPFSCWPPIIAEQKFIHAARMIGIREQEQSHA